MMWEHGDEVQPVEFLDDRTIAGHAVEDMYWLERAEQAARSGFMDAEASAAYLQERMSKYQADDESKDQQAE